MSATPTNNVTQIVTNYEPPTQRALASANRTATSILISFGVVVLPLIIKFLSDATYTRAALVSVASLIGVAVCSTLLSYALAYGHAVGSDPVYQQQRAAARNVANAVKLQALAIRYGVPAPVAPPASAASHAFVRVPNGVPDGGGQAPA